MLKIRPFKSLFHSVIMTPINKLGDYVSFSLCLLKILFLKPPQFQLVTKQLYHIGVCSFPLIVITGLSTGCVLAAQSFYQLSEKGLSSITGLFVAKSMITELGPILTAFMFTGRVGASVCAEIATMKVSEQIDALKSLCVDPLKYLLTPRLLASLLMTPLLTIFSMFTGILGGYIISVYFFNMSPVNYMHSIPHQVTVFDFFCGNFKALVFGFLIMTISCYKGISADGGAAGVGRSTIQSVVYSYCFILISNFFLTMALNGLRAKIWQLLPGLAL